MSEFQPPPRAKVFLSLLYGGSPQGAVTAEATEAMNAMEAVLGAPDLISPPLPFNFTRYYEPEMGAPLWRLAVSFAPLTSPERLVEIKHYTASLEKRLAHSDGRRRVNLDPGMLTVENLILATGKKSPHRVYLGRGVYADLALLYRDGRFAALPWTYPDYAGAELQHWLEQMRARLLAQLREAPPSCA
ncbi:MAG: DUF4416 family protein [Verrucomicrobiae bacterium]|nr:DUF4416 family protein [Verrucomicrobiae bacterium]